MWLNHKEGGNINANTDYTFVRIVHICVHYISVHILHNYTSMQTQIPHFASNSLGRSPLKVELLKVDLHSLVGKGPGGHDIYNQIDIDIDDDDIGDDDCY